MYKVVKLWSNIRTGGMKFAKRLAIIEQVFQIPSTLANGKLKVNYLTGSLVLSSFSQKKRRKVSKTFIEVI